MLTFIKRIYRAVFPRKRHPLLDAEVPPTLEDARREAAYQRGLRAEHRDDPFVSHRYAEGLRWRHVMESYLHGERPWQVLDVGAGNGAVELAFGGDPRFTPASIEPLWNDEVLRIHREGDTPIRRSLAEGDRLPFRDRTFHGVLLLETIEHLRNPAAVAGEIGRVVRGGGVVVITTPPRFRYALRPDPHFNIPGLVVLPSRLQRAVAAAKGYGGPEHYVGRIYSSISQIAALFPDCKVESVISRSRGPRRWLWDAIILRSTEETR